MKKNAMLKIAAILLVAVLLTTCAISSTFAKYVTVGNTATTTAKVAKWGVTIESTLTGLFAETYESDTDGYTGNTVASATTGTLVLAPGTSGNAAATTTISGTPEVAFEVTTEATVSLDGDWEDEDGNFYCPVVFTVNGAEVKQSATNSDAAKLAAAIKDAIETATMQVAPNIAAGTGANVAISWVWAIGDASEADSNLGNIAAGTVEGTAPSITIAFTQTATQID